MLVPPGPARAPEPFDTAEVNGLIGEYAEALAPALPVGPGA
ncbi:hypothetical protein ACFV6F_09185 [Kitasatospora phosalacinea]